MAALIKLTFITKLIFGLCFGDGDVPLQKVSSYTFKNKPVVVYKNSVSNSDIVYKIILYTSTTHDKTLQTLLVRKTDENTKNMMGANYILSEIANDGQYINYPYAWETMNVTMKDLQEDCLNVFGKKVSPLKLN
jgi:hypothetical protein